MGLIKFSVILKSKTQASNTEAIWQGISWEWAVKYCRTDEKKWKQWERGQRRSGNCSLRESGWMWEIWFGHVDMLQERTEKQILIVFHILNEGIILSSTGHHMCTEQRTLSVYRKRKTSLSSSRMKLSVPVVSLVSTRGSVCSLFPFITWLGVFDTVLNLCYGPPERQGNN